MWYDVSKENNGFSTLKIEEYLLKQLKVRQNIVVPNVCWGISYQGEVLHECDILKVTPTGDATEYEIKTSAQDVKADLKKKHCHKHKLIKCLYFVLPEKILKGSIKFIPERAGIIVLKLYKEIIVGKIIREATPNENAVKWDSSLQFELAKLGTLRIMKMKHDALLMEKEIIKLRDKLNKATQLNKK